MRKFNVINYHITNNCNYHCTYCFAKFEKQKTPTIDEAKKVIDNIADYFSINEIIDGRINFVGGEPTLYEHLDELIYYTKSIGLSVSIVTNGSLLTNERIKIWKDKVSCVGFSIDSLENNTNLKIGRSYQGKAISFDHFVELSEELHNCEIDLKINTVVSKLNISENFLPLYKMLKPKKIKLFQMHLIDGINQQAKPYAITENEFKSFCERHKEFASFIVEEPCGSMENSYLMVTPAADFQLNNKGTYQTFGNLMITSLSEILTKVPMDYEKFNSRYVIN